MSILLSLYTSQGIVFAADRNLTWQSATEQVVFEGAVTKVLAWPNKRAIVGYVGVGEMDGLQMDEWMRQFIAETREFENLDRLADLLRDRVQTAMRGYRGPVLIHLGGFEIVEGTLVPRFILVTNVPGLKPNGDYMEPRRDFAAQDELKRLFPAEVYPHNFQQVLIELEKQGDVYWLNNGYRYDCFNNLKGYLLPAFRAVRAAYDSIDPNSPFTLSDWIAYSKMSVELYGSYFKFCHVPEKRVVGGGVDAVAIAWPSS